MTSLVIIGTHRKGTSVITRALDLFRGEFLPSEDVGQYRERSAMRSQCDSLLEQFDGAGDFPRVMPLGCGHSESVHVARACAGSAISDYGDPEVLLWKNPRASLIMHPAGMRSEEKGMDKDENAIDAPPRSQTT